MKMIATTMRPQSRLPSKHQGGFTLVELMVALALSLLVVAASVSALLVSRQGFTTTDAASQLRDNARFATDFITRLSVQSGFKDLSFVDTGNQNKFRSIAVAVDPDPPIFGFENATLGKTSADPLGSSSNNSRNSCPASEGTACKNGSDILVMRYQTGSLNTDLLPGSSEVDKAMFNCAGVPETVTPSTSSDFVESMLYVAFVNGQNNNEPTLMCKYRNGSGGAWANPTPLVQGVETFKVLYGTDGVEPNKVPVAYAPIGTKPVAGQPDSIPERYLRADQMTVPGNAVATNENWRRVRSLRIGLVVRGAAGSAQDAGDRTIYPFAPNATSKNPPPAESAFAAKLEIKKADADTRARQAFTFTVHLHNFQGM
jgi:type IV pilus assembly protein PilW